MKGYRFVFVCITLSLALFGCGKDDALFIFPPQLYSITATGGIGNAATGGDGGDMTLSNHDADGIKVFASGGVDTSFSLPAMPLPDLGAENLIVMTNTVINAYASDAAGRAAVSNGSAYMYLGNTTIRKRVDATTSVDVTGLQVEAGAVLVLGLNVNAAGNDGQDTAMVTLLNDAVILGTVMSNSLTSGTVGGATVDLRHDLPAEARDMGNLDLSADMLYIGPAGVIDASGSDATASDTRGGDGGSVLLTAGAGSIFTDSGSTIKANGGDGLDTGIGGWANTVDGVALVSTGTIALMSSVEASGGNGSTGGEAAPISMSADGNLYNTGSITSSGGSGSAGAGAAGGGIDLLSTAGSSHNSGALTSNGGDGTGDGGDGGNIFVETTDSIAQATNSGSITANAGDSTTDGNGGIGGLIVLNSVKGKIKCAGALTANGGTGTGALRVGGLGGTVFMSNGDTLTADVIQVSSGMSVNGGEGPDGGMGGSVQIIQLDASDDIAGGIELYYCGLGDFSGGEGVTAGGDGSLFGINLIAIAGSIVSQPNLKGLGGEATDPAGIGGDGGLVFMSASEDVTNSGTLTFTGGKSPFIAGSATTADLIAGGTVTNYGNIYLDGGEATTTDPGSISGSGGLVTLDSTATTTANSAGIITVAVGAGGETQGSNGVITIDGVDVTPSDGTLP